MINIIASTALVYLIQLLLPLFLKEDSGEKERASKALNNLGESLPVFFAVAILSVILGIEENTSLALYWLISRVLFAVLYTTGIGKKPAKEGTTYEPQVIRSLMWFISIILLIWMTINLI
jgi:uncharacterized MAPEG superfamily protein